MDKHRAANRGGRPRIGQPITVTLPDPIRRQVEQCAHDDGVTAAEALRLLITEGLMSRPVQQEVRPGSEVTADHVGEELRPATDVIAAWITADPDESRARFIRYRRVASYAKQLVQLLLDATREGVDSGVFAEQAPRGTLIAQLSDPEDWRLRGRLFFEVTAELGRRGAVIAPAKPGESDEINHEGEGYA